MKMGAGWLIVRDGHDVGFSGVVASSRRRRVRISVIALERFCGFFLLFWFIGAWVTLIVKPDDISAVGNAADASPILRLIWIPIYLLVLGLITIRVRYFLPILAISWPLLVLCMIAGISVIWSVSPEDSLRRAIALTITTFCGLYLGMRFSQLELLRLLAWALGVTMIGSWAVSLALPDLGIMKGTLAGAWRGSFAHKNQLGSTMMLAAVVFGVLAYQAERRHRNFWWMAVVSALALVLLSSSQTSLLISILLLGLFGFSKVLSLPARHAIPLAGILVAGGLGVAILGGFLVEPILAAMGRDITLTGRSEIWAGIFRAIGERPWLGYGYEAFWEGVPQEERAHNGFLDVTLGFGGVGLLVLLASYAMALRDGIRLIRMPGREEGYWVLLLLGMYFLQNITEATFLKQNDLLWILYCAVTTRAAIDIRALTAARTVVRRGSLSPFNARA